MCKQLAILLAVSSLMAACAAEPASLGTVSLDDGKNDALANYELELEIADQVDLRVEEGGVFTLDVEYVGEDTALVSGTLFTVTPGDASEIALGVDKLSWNPLDMNFAFVMYTRAAGDEKWTQFEWSYPGRGYVFEWFDEVVIDVAESAVIYDAPGDGFSVDFGSALPAGGRDLEYAIFPIPLYRIFRTLEGSYDYELTSACDGARCRY
jgi:hypothetical protein